MRLSQLLVVLFSINFLLFVTACGELESNKEKETPLITSTLSNTPTGSIPSLPTVVTSVTPSNVPKPTEASELTIGSVAPLVNRQPSNLELETYLSDLSLVEEPIGHTIETMYEDINGDGEVDLVISDYLFIGIFIWQENQYTGSFIYQGYPWKYDPGSRITLEDWTNDDIPEVIFDFRDDNGSLGGRVTNWTRYVIHCQKNDTDCKVIWAGQLGALYESYSLGGMSLLQTEVNQVSREHEFPDLEIVKNSFAIYSPEIKLRLDQMGDGVLAYIGGSKVEDSEQFYSLEGLTVLTSTRDVFSWNGTQFEWQETQILEPAKYFDTKAVLEASSNDGQNASITAKPNNDAAFLNDICQVYINGNVTGLPFGCKENFTVIKWQDIVGDGKPELVISAFSNTYTDVGFEGDYLGIDKDCIHQRVIIYQQVNGLMKQIANVTGCVVQSDLYGVRFEDVDDDGQKEILAANGWFTDSRCFSVFSTSGSDGQQDNCWYEFGHQNEVYKWNGVEFTFLGFKE